MRELLDNQFFVAIVSLLFGAGLTLIISKISGRRIRLCYSIVFSRIGISTNDPIFGNISVSLNGSLLNNLYNHTIAIENESGKDLSDITIKIFVANGTRLLSDKTIIRNSSRIIPWSEKYQSQIRISDGQQPSDIQRNIYFSSREYHIEYLNRFEIAEISTLSVRDIDNEVPLVFVESNKKGLILKRKIQSVTQTEIFKAPVSQAVKYGLLLILISTLSLTKFIDNKWIVGPILAFIGVTSSMLGAFIYRFVSFIKNLTN